MSSSVSQAVLDCLARHLEELAADFPTTADDIDPTALADHIGVLTHHLDHATGRVQEGLTADEAVYLPERGTIERLTQGAAGMARALHALAEALAYAAHGYRTAALHGFESALLRHEQATSRTVAAAKCTEARTHLTGAVTALRPTDMPGRSVRRPPALTFHRPATMTHRRPQGILP